MKKAIKKSNHTIKEDVPTKKIQNDDIKYSPWMEDYLDLFTFKLKPVNQAFIDRLSHELREWVDEEKDSKKKLKISQFYCGKKIPRETFEKWVKKHPQLKAAYDYAMTVLGNRREIGVAVREYDTSILKMMWKYDADWRDAEEWRSKLKGDSTFPSETHVHFSNISSQGSDGE